MRDVYLNAGSGFMVVLSGEIMTMPGLPKVPASDYIDIDADGNIVGLAQSSSYCPRVRDSRGAPCFAV
jgi:formate--tetrahydrofolate ligase